MDRRFLRLSVFQQNLTRVHQTLIEQSSSVATAGSLMCNRASTLGARVILSKQERKREHNNRRYLTAATYGRKQEQPLKFVPGPRKRRIPMWRLSRYRLFGRFDAAGKHQSCEKGIVEVVDDSVGPLREVIWKAKRSVAEIGVVTEEMTVCRCRALRCDVRA